MTKRPVRDESGKEGTTPGRRAGGTTAGYARAVTEGPTLIQSVQRALRLLEAVSAHEGRAPAKALSRAAGLSLPTTYHLLRTLTHEGYLQRLDDGSYVLGHRLDAVLDRGRDDRAVAQARPALAWLRDTFGGAVYLALYRDGEIVVADIVDSPRTPRIDLWVGMHDAAHATALGKCILAQLGVPARRDYLSRHALHPLTKNTVTKPDRLDRQLSRRLGVSVDNEEYAVGVSCLASPVRTPGSDGVGGLVGAVAFVTPPRRLSAVLAETDTLTAGAERVSRALALTNA